MASPDTIPCSCCDGEATHRGADGFYRCERHRLTADLAPFEVTVVESLRAQLDQCVREREALAKSYRETIDQRDELIRRAQLAVWQGLTCEKPHELIPGEPLRAQLIVLGELCGAIARAQSGQPAHHNECACEDCLQRDDDQPASGGGQP